MTSQEQKPQGLPNPYAQGGLPNPYALPTIAAAAPVNFAEEQAKAEEKKSTAKLFHNPHLIKRPLAKVTNPVKKPNVPKPTMTTSSSEAPTTSSVQHGIDYYRSTVDDDIAVIEANREARREWQKQKKDEKKFRKLYGDWKPDQPYKLRYPTKIAAYKASGEYQFSNEEFRRYLRAARDKPIFKDSSDGYSKPSRSSSSRSNSPIVQPNKMFAPPSFDEPSTANLAARAVEGAPMDETTRAPAPAFTVHDDQNGDEAYQRRVRLAQQLATSIPPPPSAEAPVAVQETAPPPPPAVETYNPTISAPPVHYNHTISAAPVHYARPSSDVQSKDAGEAESQRPSKKQKTQEASKPTKAALMMAKMGYIKGQGLGKKNDGATTHLEVKARKDQGGRQAWGDFGDESKSSKAQAVFDITGGYRKQQKEEGKFGEPSRVVVTWGCVDGVDFALDADREDGGIRQEMGDVFSAKFGPVERFHINMGSEPVPVYILFGDLMCALNAVNRFSEGYEFRGRTIRAQFYDEKKFNQLVYDH